MLSVGVNWGSVMSRDRNELPRGMFVTGKLTFIHRKSGAVVDCPKTTSIEQVTLMISSSECRRERK